MAMTLPLILLVLDWWPLGRRAFPEKLPMFAMAGVSTVITSIGMARFAPFNWSGALSLGQRISNSLISYVSYLELTFWPHDLAILYPFRISVPVWQSAAALLLLALLTGLALWQARRKPYLLAGWLWFVIGMVPAIGLRQSGWQSMADRFTYLPSIGLAIAVVWGMAELLDGHKRLAAALTVSVAAVLAVASWRHLPVWHDSVTVFRQTVAVTGANPAAQHYLASALDDQGRFDEAFAHHAEAVRLKPDYAVARYAYGLALERRGQLEAAIVQFQQALPSFPNDPELRRHLEMSRKLLQR
jgi:tetratricopeptide (TPR) repeat protein